MGSPAAKLFCEIKANVLAPMYCKAQGHFTQFGAELRRVFEDGRVASKVCWLKGGEAVEVIE